MSGVATPKVKRIGPWLLERTLGEGSFGKVKLALHESDGNRAAVKIIDKAKISDKKTLERTLREIGIMKIVNHPGVVKMYDCFDTGDKFFVVMELIEGGELFDYIIAHQRVAEAKAKRFFREIVEAMEYCHSLGIIHRDLKPENILLDEHKRVKVIDFGLSNTLKADSMLKSRCGSPYYVAPEMVAGRSYGVAADVWSLGIILFSLLSGDVPFQDPDLTRLLQKIMEGKFVMPRYFSDEARDLVTRLLTTDPRKRISLADVRTHPWAGMSPYKPPAFTMTISVAAERIDSTILEMMAEVGHDPDTVVQLLQRGESCPVTNMYRTILDHRIANNKPPPEDKESKPALSLSLPRAFRPRSGSLFPAIDSGGRPKSATPRRPQVLIQNDPEDARRPSLPPAPMQRPVRRDDVGEEAMASPKDPTKTSSLLARRNARKAADKEKEKEAVAMPKPTPIVFYPDAAKKASHLAAPTPTDQELDVKMDIITNMLKQGVSPLPPETPFTRGLPEAPPATPSTATYRRNSISSPMELKTFSELQEAALAELEAVQEARTHLGPVNCTTISLRPVVDIANEVRRVLNINKVEYKAKGKLSFKAEHGGVKFHLEVCALPNLTNVHAIHFKRRAGDTWKYNHVVSRLISQMKLQ